MQQHIPSTSYCNYSGGEDCCNSHSVRPGTSSEEDKNEADDDYFESDIVIEDVEEGDSGDIHKDNCVIAEEDFELDMLQLLSFVTYYSNHFKFSQSYENKKMTSEKNSTNP